MMSHELKAIEQELCNQYENFNAALLSTYEKWAMRLFTVYIQQCGVHPQTVIKRLSIENISKYPHAVEYVLDVFGAHFDEELSYLISGWLADARGVCNKPAEHVDQTGYDLAEAISAVMTRDELKHDVYFCDAENRARLSRDTTKVGAVIVKGNEIVSGGYNGPPARFNDDIVPTNREPTPYRAISPAGRAVTCKTTKYSWTRHAEANAIRYALRRDHVMLDGSAIYVTHFPCKDCALSIAENGIAEVHVRGSFEERNGSYFYLVKGNNGGMTAAPIDESLVLLLTSNVKVFFEGVEF
jgi:deoxycytidylate deaminase